jgi:hypothetical protein
VDKFKITVMKKILILSALLAVIFSCSFGQTTDAEAGLRAQAADSVEGWKKGGVISLNLSQTSLTNWTAGGQNALSANALTSLFANYKKGKSVWASSLDMGYGILKQGKDEDLIKTDDKLDLLSKYGRQAINKWYYTTLLNFKTQMTAGYNYPNDSVKISGPFAPAYILGSLGVEYKPNDDLNIYISPFTSKITIVADQDLANSGAFGVTPADTNINGIITSEGENVRFELGGYIRMEYRKELMENITILTKLDLFSNYLNNPQNIDVNWETLLTLKVNKYISATLSTQLIYDDDIKIAGDTNDDGEIEYASRTQFKEVLGIGFSYNF